jgi:hypothetical protein
MRQLSDGYIGNWDLSLAGFAGGGGHANPLTQQLAHRAFKCLKLGTDGFGFLPLLNLERVGLAGQGRA